MRLFFVLILNYLALTFDKEIHLVDFGVEPGVEFKTVGKTFAEIEQERKNLVSHRGRAMREFTARLLRLLNSQTE